MAQDALSPGQWYLSVDGDGLGLITSASDPHAFTTTGPFQGAEQQARSTAASVVYPIGPFSTVFLIS